MENNTLKSANDLLKLGYTLDVRSPNDNWIIDKDGQKLMGLPKGEEFWEEQCFSINENNIVTAVFL